jgi:hypothetical protein
MIIEILKELFHKMAFIIELSCVPMVRFQGALN